VARKLRDKADVRLALNRNPWTDRWRCCAPHREDNQCHLPSILWTGRRTPTLWPADSDRLSLVRAYFLKFSSSRKARDKANVRMASKQIRQTIGDVVLQTDKIPPKILPTVLADCLWLGRAFKKLSAKNSTNEKAMSAAGIVPGIDNWRCGVLHTEIGIMSSVRRLKNAHAPSISTHIVLADFLW
jgi:hypothetical protein